jgi:hypothetical protein
MIGDDELMTELEDIINYATGRMNVPLIAERKL